MTTGSSSPTSNRTTNNSRRRSGSRVPSRSPDSRLRREHHRQGARQPGGTVIPLLQPGSFVRLHNHPTDLPPFELIACRGGRCWVRQQAWGAWVQWEVAYRQLTAAA